MVKTYRSLKQWNNWLRYSRGKNILTVERNLLAGVLGLLPRNNKFGLLIGVPEQESLLEIVPTLNHILLTPFICSVSYASLVEADLYNVPLVSGSFNVVLLAHSFEYVSSPKRLLAEACRLVKPMGHIVIIGFHPWGLNGIKKAFFNNSFSSMKANFIFPHKIKYWLKLFDFRLVRPRYIQFINNIYVLVAEARTIPATPIRLQWKQAFPVFGNKLAGPFIQK